MSDLSPCIEDLQIKSAAQNMENFNEKAQKMEHIDESDDKKETI